MHELSLIQGILKICLQKAEEEKALSITSITLEIGELAGVSPEALAFGFEVAKKNSLAKDATLHIESLLAQGVCPNCHHQATGRAAMEVCSKCRSALTFTEGRELRVISMEIEECVRNAAV